MRINGWVNVNKEIGCTSLDCVRYVKRLFGVRKAGHFGTLDPMATGVLPIAIGEATKVIPLIDQHTKGYDFDVQWGKEMTTDDAEGSVIFSSDKIPSMVQVEEVIKNFIGEIQQVPPLFSAVKVNGKRAYDLARAGLGVELGSKTVFVHSLRVLSHDNVNGKTRFTIECGSGTYIRSLARDMGRLIGCFGHAVRILRFLNGPFHIDDSKIRADISCDSILGYDYPVRHFTQIEVSDKDEKRIKSGTQVQLNHLLAQKICGTYCRASRDGVVFAICRLSEFVLNSVCIFNI